MLYMLYTVYMLKWTYALHHVLHVNILKSVQKVMLCLCLCVLYCVPLLPYYHEHCNPCHSRWISVKDQRVQVVSSACGWMGALRQTAMLYGSLVLEWQCQSEVCWHNNDHSEMLMQLLTAGRLASMHKCTCMHTTQTQNNPTLSN